MENLKSGELDDAYESDQEGETDQSEMDVDDDLEGELKWGSDIPSERIGAICARLINGIHPGKGTLFAESIA